MSLYLSTFWISNDPENFKYTYTPGLYHRGAWTDGIVLTGDITHISKVNMYVDNILYVQNSINVVSGALPCDKIVVEIFKTAKWPGRTYITMHDAIPSNHCKFKTDQGLYVNVSF